MCRQSCILILLWVAFFTEAQVVNAQTRSGMLESSVGIARIIRNYPDFPSVNHPAFIASLKYSQKLSGFKPWHRYYNYPVASLNLTGGALGNNAVLGHFAGLMAEFSFEKRISNKLFWAPRVCLGTAWFSKPYNELQNPENVVIGSAFTFLVSAEAALGYKLNSKTDLLFKFTLLHASNSHFKLPNVGMNLPAVSIGGRYHFGNASITTKDTTKISFNHRPQIHIRVAVGFNEMGSSTTPVNGPKYPVYLGSVYIAKLFSPVNKVSAGIEAWCNKGVYDFIVSQEFYETHRHNKASSVALVFGHEYLMGHFGLLTTIGVYLYNPFYRDRLERNDITGFKDKLKSYVPARLGFQYYLKSTMDQPNSNVFLGLYIKSNLGQADFLESSVGYMF